MVERIIQIREREGLSQERFAKKLGLSRNFINQVENGKKNFSDRTISDICEEFSINEDWLRTGNGEMSISTSHDKQIESFINDTLTSESDSFRRRLISALANMDDAGWDALEKLINSFQIKDNVVSNTFKKERDIDEMVEDYRRQLELEKKAEEKSEASQKSG